MARSLCSEHKLHEMLFDTECSIQRALHFFSWIEFVSRIWTPWYDHTVFGIAFLLRTEFGLYQTYRDHRRKSSNGVNNMSLNLATALSSHVGVLSVTRRLSFPSMLIHCEGHMFAGVHFTNIRKGHRDYVYRTWQYKILCMNTYIWRLSSWASKYTRYKKWDEITYSWFNCRSLGIDTYMITYPFWN